MLKRIIAVSLAVLMLLACAASVSAAGQKYTIKTAEDLKLLAQHPDGEFEIVCDIDYENQAWTAVGTAEKPFTGTIHGNGKEISNIKFADGAVVGFIGYNAGTIEDVNIFEYSANSGKAQLFGGFVAVNNGTVKNCTTMLGEAKITAPAGSKIGQICAVNNGTVEDSKCAIDITVSASSSVQIGGLAAVNAGTMKNSEAAGRMILTGKASAGLLFAEVASGSLAETCLFTGSMATMDGELMKTMLPSGNKSANLKDCLWRDNTSSLELLPKEAQETRLKVVDYCIDLASLVWIVPKDIDYNEPDSDNPRGGHGKYYKQGEIWYGMEYSHRGKYLGSFEYSIDENDVLKDFIDSGPNSIDIYMSNDCSGIMISSFWVVSPSCYATTTKDIMPGYDHQLFGNNNILKVGDYTISKTALKSGLTADIYKHKKNTEEVMKEAWAQALPGDGCNSTTDGHARLFVGSKIMRDANNIIDPVASKLYINGMGDGITRRLYHADVEVYGEYTMESFLEEEYIPLTTKELREGKSPEAEVSLTDEGKHDRAHICEGIVHSNYPTWGCRMKILDSTGKVVWEHTLWDKVFLYDGSNYSMRVPYYDFNLNRFSTSFATANLTEGKTYTVKVTTMLSNRGEYPVKEYSFVY